MPMRPLTDRAARRRAAIFTAAFSVYLGAVETVLPHPIPFLHYGLGNIPLLIAVPQLPFGWFLAAVAVKLLGQGLLGGLLLSPLMAVSAAGSLTAALAMKGFYRLFGRFCTLTGVSVLAAFVSDAVRLAAAALFLGSAGAAAVALPFFLCGWGCSLLTGAAARRMLPHCPLADVPAAAGGALRRPAEAQVSVPRNSVRSRFGSVLRPVPFAAAVAGALSGNAAVCLLLFAGIAVTAAVCRLRNRWGMTASAFVCIVLFALMAPDGKLLAEWGPLRITAGALEVGLYRAASFCALVLASRLALMRGEPAFVRRFRAAGEFFAYFEAFWALSVDGGRILSRPYLKEVSGVLAAGSPAGAGAAAGNGAVTGSKAEAEASRR